MGYSSFVQNCRRIIENPGSDTVRSLVRHSLWHFIKRFAPLPLEVPLTQQSSLSIVDRKEMNGCVALAWGQGLYDYHNMSFLLELTKRASFARVCLDIGANIGIYSLLMSENEGVSVHAFEPHPATFHTLERTLEYNRRPQVKAWNYALSDRDGVVSFSNTDFNPTNRIIAAGEQGMATTEVMALRGEDWCRRENVSPDIIKIDTEGHEASVLQGLGAILQTTKLVFVEENVPLHDTLLAPSAGIFHGPWYVDFPRRTLTKQKHAPEDAVYCNIHSIEELHALGYTLPSFS